MPSLAVTYVIKSAAYPPNRTLQTTHDTVMTDDQFNQLLQALKQQTRSTEAGIGDLCEILLDNNDRLMEIIEHLEGKS